MSDGGVPGNGRQPERARTQVHKAVGHTVETASFFGSLMAGLLIGWVVDHFAGTRPAFIVVGIICGFGVGFWRMWVDYTRAMDEGR